MVTNLLVKRYLEEKFRTKRSSSYMRIGKQIVDFLQRFINSQFKVIRSVSHKIDTENVQMPESSMVKLRKSLPTMLSKLKSKK